MYLLSMKEIIYSFPPAAIKPSPFYLQMAGVSYCDGSYRIRRKNSAKFVLEYVTHGRGTVYLNDKVFYPKAGDVYFLHRGMDHDYYSDKKEPWIKYWFNVEGSLNDHFVQAYGLSQTFHVKDAGAEIYQLFRKGIHAVKEHYLCKDQSGVHKTIALVFHRILMGLSDRIQAPSGSDTVRTMKEYIDGHFHQPVSLANIGREAGCSPSTAIRLFRKETGMTPYDYLLERRVTEAKLLLHDTALPVKVISTRTGFCDEFHFSAYFKRRTGISPKTFRKSP